MDREAVYKEANKAAEEYIFARWRTGAENDDESYVAATSYIDARWPQIGPCPRGFPPPAWAKIVGILGLPVVFIWACAINDPGPDESFAFVATIVWAVSWWVFHSLSKSSAEQRNIPYIQWIQRWETRSHARNSFVDHAVAVNARLIAASGDRERAAEREREAERERQDALRRPQPIFDCTYQEAEVLAARWMKHLGESDAVVSQATRDGGADVESGRFVAEVKHQSKPVGPVPVRAIVGVAYSKRKVPVFFSLNGYTRDATEFGSEAGALLFEYDPERGTLQGATALSRKAILGGLQSMFQAEEG